MILNLKLFKAQRKLETADDRKSEEVITPQDIDQKKEVVKDFLIIIFFREKTYSCRNNQRMKSRVENRTMVLEFVEIIREWDPKLLVQMKILGVLTDLGQCRHGGRQMRKM